MIPQNLVLMLHVNKVIYKVDLYMHNKILPCNFYRRVMFTSCTQLHSLPWLGKQSIGTKRSGSNIWKWQKGFEWGGGSVVGTGSCSQITHQGQDWCTRCQDVDNRLSLSYSSLSVSLSNREPPHHAHAPSRIAPMKWSVHAREKRTGILPLLGILSVATTAPWRSR